MKRRGFLGSLLGLAAAKIAGVKVPEPVTPPPVLVPVWDYSLFPVGGDATVTTTTNVMNGSTLWLKDGKYFLNGQEVPWSYTKGTTGVTLATSHHLSRRVG